MSNQKIDLRTSEGRKQQAMEAAQEAVAPIADKVDALLALLAQQGGISVGTQAKDASQSTKREPEIAPVKSTPSLVPTYKANKAKKSTTAKPKTTLPKKADVTPVDYYFDDSGCFHAVYDPRANGMNHTKNGNPCIASHQKGLIPFTLPWDDSKVLLFAQGTVMIGEAR